MLKESLGFLDGVFGSTEPLLGSGVTLGHCLVSGDPDINCFLASQVGHEPYDRLSTASKYNLPPFGDGTGLTNEIRAGLGAATLAEGG